MEALLQLDLRNSRWLLPPLPPLQVTHRHLTITGRLIGRRHYIVDIVDTWAGGMACRCHKVSGWRDDDERMTDQFTCAQQGPPLGPSGTLHRNPKHFSLHTHAQSWGLLHSWELLGLKDNLCLTRNRLCPALLHTASPNLGEGPPLGDHGHFGLDFALGLPRTRASCHPP